MILGIKQKWKNAIKYSHRTSSNILLSSIYIIQNNKYIIEIKRISSTKQAFFKNVSWTLGTLNVKILKIPRDMDNAK